MIKPGPVWGLDTGHIGEFMQVAALGNALGLEFTRIRLPSAGQSAGHSAELLAKKPPRLILSFGRAAPAALRLADSVTPRPLLVHLGTPGHRPSSAFDLIIPMPQDDYPPVPNVCFLRLPLNGATLAESRLPEHRRNGGCTIIVGGLSRHFRISKAAIRRLIRFGVRLAAANAEALQVVTSPRTPRPILAELRRLAAARGFALHEFGSAPFAGFLQNGSRFVVTADSASMLAEACRTGAPVWLFPLPWRPNFSDFLQLAADRLGGRRLRHWFVRRGWLGGGTDFKRWHRQLEETGHLVTAGPVPEAALRWKPAANRPDSSLRDCRERILGILSGPERRDPDKVRPPSPLPSGSDSDSRNRS